MKKLLLVLGLGGDIENLNLASLPPSMIHQILSKVATNSIRDFSCARVVFSGFNAIGREYYFYRPTNLIFVNDWIKEVNDVRTFRLRCYHLGNPDAIYL
ncbi:BnaC05g51850D [Brassica napus]|uniref:BnaC05g51850D protein n=1 Tax=Brassica napus TaxID=3708 RepID=A0A078IVA8_BRANA|nr:BnaC05g51850D [Brassica napus]